MAENRLGKQQMAQEEITVDVLVVGTGASGMAAAVTAAAQGLDVLVVEKEPRFGGTTARSGGWLWIPGTRLATEQGIKEPPGAAKAYLKHETTTHFNEKRVDAFLEHGPKAIDFFTKNTCVQFDMPAIFPDYHAEVDGGQPGGRSMVTRPFDGRELGARAHSVRNDAGLRARNQTLHARVQIVELLPVRHKASG
jgi:succinate dehydrogenase/fumarate reductase flavoprotein subunit